MTQPQQPPEQQPQQPYGYGPPQPPAPKPRMSRGKKIGIGIGAVFTLIIVGAVAGGGEESGDTGKEKAAAEQPKDQAPAAKDDKPVEEAKDKPEPKPEPKPVKKSQADEFKAFVTKNGTPQEQDAATHVTKVQGADSQNDILDSAEIYTDYTGGIVGPHAADGKLLASAFADWKNSENGLVTVYDASGEILSNGNF